MNIRLEYNRKCGWLHFSNPLDGLHDRDDYTDILLGKTIPIEYATAFQDYMLEKYPDMINILVSNKTLPIYKVQDELDAFIAERKLKI